LKSGLKLLALNLALWLVLELVAFAVLSSQRSTDGDRSGGDRSDRDRSDKSWLTQARLSFEGGLYVWDPHCLWTLQPGYVSDVNPGRKFWGEGPLRVNDLGMRGPSHAKVRPDGIKRILILGGSHPMGMYVNYEETYGARLQASLGDGWEVLNAAAPGHTSFQTAQYLAHYGTAFSPDIVIADVGVNDALPLTPDFPQPDHLVKRPPRWAKDARSALRHSNVYRLLRQWLTRAEELPPSEFAVRVPPGLRQQNLAAMRALGTEHGFTVVVINQFRADLHGSGHIQCLSEDADLEPRVDACDLWRGLGDVRGWFADPVHANSQGHALLAGRILARLRALQLVP
jgi:lysophospholipase L1-like esterase